MYTYIYIHSSKDCTPGTFSQRKQRCDRGGNAQTAGGNNIIRVIVTRSRRNTSLEPPPSGARAAKSKLQRCEASAASVASPQKRGKASPPDNGRVLMTSSGPQTLHPKVFWLELTTKSFRSSARCEGLPQPRMPLAPPAAQTCWVLSLGLFGGVPFHRHIAFKAPGTSGLEFRSLAGFRTSGWGSHDFSVETTPVEAARRMETSFLNSNSASRNSNIP